MLDSHDVKQVSKPWEFPFVTRKWFDREDVLMNDAMCLVGLTFWLAHWSTDAWKLPLHSVETDKLSNFIYNCMTVVFKLLLVVHIGKSPSHSPCVLHFLKVITSCWTQQQDTDRSLPHEPQKRRLYLCQYKHRNNLFLANSVHTLPTPQVRLFSCQYKLCSMAYPLLNHCQLLNTKFCFCQHKSTLKWPIPG